MMNFAVNATLEIFASRSTAEERGRNFIFASAQDGIFELVNNVDVYSKFDIRGNQHSRISRVRYDGRCSNSKITNIDNATRKW